MGFSFLLWKKRENSDGGVMRDIPIEENKIWYCFLYGNIFIYRVWLFLLFLLGDICSEFISSGYGVYFRN